MTNDKAAVLSPAQKAAYDGLLYASKIGQILNLWSGTGRGRTTVLTELHRTLGGVFLTTRDFVEAASKRHPLAVEDAMYDIMLSALRENDCVFIEDFHVATSILRGSCGRYPREGYIESSMSAIAAYVVEAGKRLILGSNGSLPDAFEVRSFDWSIHSFSPDDYRHLCETFLGTTQNDIDYEKIHRFAPKLNAHQLKQACAWCGQPGVFDTERLLDYLRSQHLTSNVELGEVAQVDLRDLKGIEDVLQLLEANIVVPFENDNLAQELSLKPKRGVLLVGPPGTGKTTVGRALAHRLKGKFFLIDGTVISGTQHFYGIVDRIFEAAKENAPAVIFIDDSDVIFESGQEHGLYRYLLTMLDGLESKSANRVCVMMTAMDVGNLPPALIRSGRIELWLEMRLPDPSARSSILQEAVAQLPTPLREIAWEDIVEATNGFTGADLRRLVEDAKALYAFDRAYSKPILPPTDYFEKAAAGIVECKERYQAAASRANASRPSRPVWFNPASHLDED